MAKKIKTISVPKVWADKQWTVRFGRLNAGPGRPEGAPRLFKVLGEKLPFEALNKVNGVYGPKGLEEAGSMLHTTQWDTHGTSVAGIFSLGCVHIERVNNWSLNIFRFISSKTPLERRRPRHPHPEASQSGVREAEVALVLLSTFQMANRQEGLRRDLARVLIRGL